MTIYLDTEFKCHVTSSEGYTAVETNDFDGKCDAYIEGYRYVPEGSTWTREDGVDFTGKMIAPWRNYNDLRDSQYNYMETELVKANENIAELDSAFLDMAYENIVGEE